MNIIETSLELTKYIGGMYFVLHICLWKKTSFQARFYRRTGELDICLNITDIGLDSGLKCWELVFKWWFACEDNDSGCCGFCGVADVAIVGEGVMDHSTGDDGDDGDTGFTFNLSECANGCACAIAILGWWWWFVGGSGTPCGVVGTPDTLPKLPMYALPSELFDEFVSDMVGIGSLNDCFLLDAILDKPPRL